MRWTVLFFFKGTQEKEPANFGASLGRSGLKQKLPQQRSQSLPTLGCHLTMPTLSSLSVLLSTGLMFCMAMWGQQHNLQTHWQCQQKPPLLSWKGDIYSSDVCHRYCYTVDFYRSWWASSDPDGEKTLRNKDQLVFEGLQTDDTRAQLTATEWTDTCSN